MELKAQSVKVAVRIRPLQNSDLEQDSNLCIGAIRREKQIVAGSDTVFTFDHVFDHNTQQSNIYDECVQDLVDAAFEGFNATILAYGQTGSGKTWTMGSASDVTIKEDNYGIIPRVINNLFHMIHDKEEAEGNSTYKVHVQFLEIYGEEVRDLLDHTKTAKVTIRETADGELFIAGAKEEHVGSFEQMMRTLEDGTKNRSTAATKMNLTSSRSHAIFTVFLEHTLHLESASVTGGNGDPAKEVKKEVRKSKFHFVDLAGSERAKRTGAAGQQLKEGININQGLLALGNVISALGDEKKRGKVFVPYRDSKLTRMLQDSLGGNSKTLMICCVSPALSNLTESINALRYANRARNIQNKPVVNRDPTLVVIDGLKKVLKVVSSELYDIRVGGKIIEVQNGVSNDMLAVLANQGVSNSEVPMLVAEMDGNGNFSSTAKNIYEEIQSAANRSSKGGDLSSVPGGGGSVAHTAAMSGSSSLANLSLFGSRGGSLKFGSISSSVGSSGSGGVQIDKATLQAFKKAVHDLELTQNRLRDADFEVKRLSDKLKAAKTKDDSDYEQLLLITTEKDFYKMKWAEASPEEARRLLIATCAVDTAADGSSSSSSSNTNSNNDPLLTEMKDTMGVVAGYIREIDDLKLQLANAELANKQQKDELEASSFNPPSDEEYTTSIALLIEQTKQQLQDETDRMKRLEGTAGSNRANSTKIRSNNNGATNNNRSSSKGAKSKVGIAVQSEDDGDDDMQVGFGLSRDIQDDSDDEDDDDDDEDMSEEERDKASGEHLQDVEDQEREFNRRQHVMESEVSELGQSIIMKEKLVAQLAKSQHQYSAMKEFYEKKLASLTTEVKAKQDERDGLLSELTTLQSKREDSSSEVAQQREEQLKKILSKKDDELKSLKKKQEELSKLSQVQSRYTTQLNKLEADITSMKKQRVDLAKSLHAEKKTHLLMLNNKAKEIAKLKKELMKSALEMKKLGRGKDIAETRMRDAIRKQQLASQQQQQQQQQVAGKLPPSSSTFSSSKSQTEVGVVRDNIRNVNRMVRHGSNNQIPATQSELQTKRWLNKRIGEISAREAAADALKKEYETQLALLNKKAELELDRKHLANRSAASSKDSFDNRYASTVSAAGVGLAVESSGNNNKNNNNNNNKGLLTRHNRRPSSDYESDNSAATSPMPPVEDELLVLSAAEEQKLLEIENSLASIDTQLSDRAKQISSIQDELNSLGGGGDEGANDDEGAPPHAASSGLERHGSMSPSGLVTTPDNSSKLGTGGSSKGLGYKHKSSSRISGGSSTLEVLKKTAAGSLPAAHELIRLLFDMLVGSQKTSNTYKSQIAELTEKLKKMKREVDDGIAKLSHQKRVHDQELTQKEAEYEEKLLGIFNNMTQKEPDGEEEDEDKGYGAEERGIRHRGLVGSMPSSVASGGTAPSPAVSTSGVCVNNNSKHTVISVDEYKFLKDKIQKEAMRLVEMQFRVDDVEESRQALIEEIEEKNIQIKFLEDDRAVFKEMVDDLKAGLAQFGKPGKTMLESLKEESLSRRKSVMNIGHFPALSSTTFDDIAEGSDEDDEFGEGMMDAFDFLADEINRTGTAALGAPALSSNTNSGTNSAVLSSSAEGAGIPPPVPPTYPHVGSNISNNNNNNNSNNNNGGNNNSTSNSNTGTTNSPSSRASRSASGEERPATNTSAATAATATAPPAPVSAATPVAKPVVYDRLTNPTYFTGHMKKVFDTEVETKRKRVLQTRASERVVSQTHGVSTAALPPPPQVNPSGSGGGGGPSPANGGGGGAFESMGMRRSNSCSVAAVSPRRGDRSDLEREDLITTTTTTTAAPSGDVFSRLAGKPTIAKQAKEQQPKSRSTSINASSNHDDNGHLAMAAAARRENSPALPLSVAAGGENKEKTSVYAKKTENFMSAISTKINQPIEPMMIASVRSSDEASLEDEKAVNKGVRINTASPVLSVGGAGSGPSTAAGHTPGNAIPNGAGGAAAAVRGRLSIGSTGTASSLAYSSNSQGTPRLDQHRPSALNISGDNAFDSPLSSHSVDESHTRTTTPPNGTIVGSADITPMSSASRHHNPKERWSTAGTGRWHKDKNSTGDGEIIPGESAAHLKHLQDELQKAVDDLGNLVEDSSSSRSRGVTPTHSRDASEDMVPPPPPGGGVINGGGIASSSSSHSRAASLLLGSHTTGSNRSSRKSSSSNLLNATTVDDILNAVSPKRNSPMTAVDEGNSNSSNNNSYL